LVGDHVIQREAVYRDFTRHPATSAKGSGTTDKRVHVFMHDGAPPYFNIARQTFLMTNIRNDEWGSRRRSCMALWITWLSSTGCLLCGHV